MAQHLSKVLTPITNLADQKLKNTYEAKEKLSNHSIPDNYELVSFDVQKLFTSIPHDLLCLSTTTFKFNGVLYKQISGLTMGSPISVVLSEIVQLTYECQINNQISFLDMKITAYETGVKSYNVFRKPSNSGKYLDFNSYHISTQKSNVILALKSKAHKICSENTVNREYEVINN